MDMTTSFLTDSNNLNMKKTVTEFSWLCQTDGDL